MTHASPSPSEAWLWRMMEELDDTLAMIVFNDIGGNGSWRDHIPIRPLHPYRSLPWRCLSRWRNETEKMIACKNLSRAIRSSGATHVLCHYGVFAIRFMDIWRTLKIPLFIHFHGFDATLDRRQEYDANTAAHPVDYRERLQELSQYARFIANSEFTRGLLLSAGVAENRIDVKYLGVPLPKAGKVHQSKDELHILHLGRLIDFKSPDRTIRAFEIACEKGLRGRLTLAGDGAMRVTCELMRQRSKWKESIRITGTVTLQDGQKLLSEADIFTQHNIQGEISRQSECFGVSILEAMAAGVPVVGTRNGGVVETVVNGETGFLVEPGDVEGQAECFLKLAKDATLRQQLGDAERKRIAEKFSMEIERERFRAIMKLN